jgi:hypothetical protein
MNPFIQMFPKKLFSYAKLPSYCAKQMFSKRFSYRALKGLESNSGLPINVLYLGEEHTLEYLKTLFFRSVTHDSLIEQYSLLDVMRGIRPMPEGYDLCISEFTPRSLHLIPKKSQFRIPEWIEQEVPLAGSWEDVVSRFSKHARSNELRLVRKYNYASDVVTDPAAIKQFYHELYLPYVNQRFQEAVEIVDDEWLIAVAGEGGLLRILNNDQVIAGGVFYRDKQFLDGIWLGALMQNGQDIYKGSFSSLYYHSIKYAHNEGFPTIKLGLSRSFLTDGVYRFKRKWGAQLLKSRYKIFTLMVDINFHSQACQQWLEASPFITEQSKGLYANFFVLSETAKEMPLVKRIENLVSPGLIGVNVYSSGQLADLPDSIGSCQIHNIDINNTLHLDNN